MTHMIGIDNQEEVKYNRKGNLSFYVDGERSQEALMFVHQQLVDIANQFGVTITISHLDFYANPIPKFIEKKTSEQVRDKDKSGTKETKS